MTIGLLFWVLMLIWLIFGFAYNSGMVAGWTDARGTRYGLWGNSLLLFVLLLLLGWQTFGAPIR